MRDGFWWVYVLEREDGSLYTGIAKDPRARFELHRQGKGARAMRVSPPKRLLSIETGGAYPQALRREAQIKKLSRKAKDAYVKDPGSLPLPASSDPWLHKNPKKTKKSKRKKSSSPKSKKRVYTGDKKESR